MRAMLNIGYRYEGTGCVALPGLFAKAGEAIMTQATSGRSSAKGSAKPTALRATLDKALSGSGGQSSWTPRLSGLGTSDAALALGVIAIVGLMIVPLPTWLLDVFLAMNISLSVAILLVVLYVPNALAIATFPSLLLITTLFRLALNVSSSRLILLQADAGDVIRAFGTFVVRGNYVVGAVVFLILTIIQFVVIAKGSERVAEVAARFALDAMPGKQMAIDAELRAGAIDGQQARRRRNELTRESQFYGAMDGAMKFVKGDVIASLVITLVNIIGGLAVGVLQRDMAAGMALKRYGLLTIGDGLVTQIPALVLATSAGMLVTRVASEDGRASLGQELAVQLFGTPKAMRVASVFVLLLALVPGLPLVPFLVIGVVLWVIAAIRERQLARHAREQELQELRPTQATAAKGVSFVPVVTPWALHVGTELESMVDDFSQDGRLVLGIRSRMLQVRERLFAELGLPMAPAVVRVSEQLPAQRVVLSMFEVPFGAVDVQGVSCSDALASIEVFVSRSIRFKARDYMGIAETQMLLDQLDQVAPALVRQVVPKPLSVTLVTEVLGRLVEEGISVRNLRAILHALATAGPTEKDPVILTEMVRAHLRDATTFQLTAGAKQLSAFVLDYTIENLVRDAIQQTPSGTYLALAPDQCRAIVQAIVRTISEVRARGAGRDLSPLVLLTQPDIRRFVRKLTESDLPDLKVVSPTELVPQVTLDSLGCVTLSEPSMEPCP